METSVTKKKLEFVLHTNNSSLSEVEFSSENKVFIFGYSCCSSAMMTVIQVYHFHTLIFHKGFTYSFFFR